MPSKTKSREVSPKKSASKKKSSKKDTKVKSSKKDSSSKKSSKKGKDSKKSSKKDKKSSKKKRKRDDSSDSDSESDSSDVDSASVDEISCGIESYTREQFIDLRNWNKYACGLHFFQSFLQLVLGVTTPGIKDFALPITVLYLGTETGTASDGTEYSYLGTQWDTLGTMTFPPFVSMFLLLSAIFHYIAMSGHYQPHYRKWINRGKNYFRWIEYSASSTFMSWVVAQLAGCYDIGTLLLISGANITMNLLGLLQEMFNNVRDLNREISWFSFNLGVFIGMLPWFIILLYAASSPALPGYVVALMIPTMLFFQSFPVNMYLQYARIGQWQEYIFGEKYYIFMSLMAKSALAWLVFLNLQQPNQHNTQLGN